MQITKAQHVEAQHPALQQPHAAMLQHHQHPPQGYQQQQHYQEYYQEHHQQHYQQHYQQQQQQHLQPQHLPPHTEEHQPLLAARSQQTHHELAGSSHQMGASPHEEHFFGIPQGPGPAAATATTSEAAAAAGGAAAAAAGVAATTAALAEQHSEPQQHHELHHEPHLHNHAVADGHGIHAPHEVDPTQRPREGQLGIPANTEPTEEAALAIMQAMHERVFNPRAQEEACFFLEEMSETPRGADAVVSQGGIMAIIKAMVSHPQDVDLQVQACAALLHAVGSNEEHQRLAVSMGGIDAIVNTIRKHHLSELVVEKAMWALWQLTNCHDARWRFLSGSGFLVVKQALEQHSRSASLQEATNMAISNLAYEEDARLKAAGLGIPEAIVESMRRNSEDVGVQEAAIFALFNLACSLECIRGIQERGGAYVLRTAMDNHPSVHDLDEAKNLLSQLTTGQ